jgi:hypothetical protein
VLDHTTRLASRFGIVATVAQRLAPWT